MMRFEKASIKAVDDRQSPEWSKLLALSSWVVWIAGAMDTLQYQKAVFAAPRPVESSVLSNRIGLEKSRVGIQR
jgi:hypothetical protein